ncbi:hypothetical protein [Brevibacillus migulae]|uniref:hypothetical protein n=1 Tax=Brevibacillus migulae TaxID=1644114 RepID=UPI00106E1181|nr:hypothetical protein [Brevibacillus migulae]
MKRHKRIWAFCLMAVLLLLAAGCSGGESTTNENGLSASFDAENAKEYGIRGVYLGQGIAEAMQELKPTQYEFMDAETRQSMTIDQLAKGEGTVSMGMILIDKAQLMMKVRAGVVESIIMGSVPTEAGKQFATNRGFPLYGTVEELKQLYGNPTSEGNEWVYKGSKYQALFSIHEGKVIGFRFDPVQ